MREGITTSGLLEKTSELWRFLRDGDLSKAPLWLKVCVYPIRILIRAFEEFFNDKCILRASSLAYASLLALIPVTAIFFLFFTKFDAFGKDIKERVEDLLFNNLVPTQTDTIRGYITEHTENVSIIGAIGFITLFVMSIFLFNTIEHTINDIWNAKQRRRRLFLLPVPLMLQPRCLSRSSTSYRAVSYL